MQVTVSPNKKPDHFPFGDITITVPKNVRVESFTIKEFLNRDDTVEGAVFTIRMYDFVKNKLRSAQTTLTTWQMLSSMASFEKMVETAIQKQISVSLWG